MKNTDSLGNAIDAIADGYKKMMELARPSDVEIASMIAESVKEQPLDMLEEKLERHLKYPFGREGTWLYEKVTLIFKSEIEKRRRSPKEV